MSRLCLVWENVAFMAPAFDFSDPQLRLDPYPIYARMRREAPVVIQERGMLGKVHFVFRYEDVLRVLKDEKVFANDNRAIGGKPPPWWAPSFIAAFQQNMVGYDGADHRRLRNLVHKAFTPNRIDALNGRIGELVDGYLGAAKAKGTVDLIEGYALPLPLAVISEMLDVGERDRYRFRRWVAGLTDLDGGGTLGLVRAFVKASRIMRFLRRLIAERRVHRGEDIVSALIAAEEAGDRLSFEELVNMVFLMLFAGHETTVNLLGNGVLALLDHPDQLERLRKSPELIDTAVDELLRFTNPVQHPSPRFVKEDVVLSGTLIPRGSKVLPLLGSANRDEQAFTDADQLDVGRTPNKHVAFGFGVHYCLGAPLARLEARRALLALIDRFPKLRLAVPREQIRWRNSTALRGLTELPLALS